jgi:hypothetical protein
MNLLWEKLEDVIPRHLYLADIDKVLDLNLINVII